MHSVVISAGRGVCPGAWASTLLWRAVEHSGVGAPCRRGSHWRDEVGCFPGNGSIIARGWDKMEIPVKMSWMRKVGLVCYFVMVVCVALLAYHKPLPTFDRLLYAVTVADLLFVAGLYSVMHIVVYPIAEIRYFVPAFLIVAICFVKAMIPDLEAMDPTIRWTSLRSLRVDPKPKN